MTPATGDNAMAALERARAAANEQRVVFCSCDEPVMDVEHDAGCRRCGLPVDFTPAAPTADDELAATAHELIVKLEQLHDHLTPLGRKRALELAAAARNIPGAQR